MCVLVICTTFHFSIEVENQKTEELETYELGDFCKIFEKEWSKTTKERGNMIVYTAAQQGVSSDSEYTTVNFIVDIGERVLGNFHFFTLKNLIVYLIIFSISATAVGMFISGFIKGIMNIPAGIKEITKKEGEKRNLIDTKGIKSLFAPLLLWGSVELFRLYNSFSLSGRFEVPNKIVTVYTGGINLLFTFAIFMAVYWIGQIIIKYVVKT